MLLFVIGVPGRCAELCETLALRLVRRALGPAELTFAGSLADIARNALSSGPAHAVVASRHPGGSVKRALRDAEGAFVVVLGSPRVALPHVMRRQGGGIAAATQTVASSCASARCFAAVPGALVFHEGQEGQETAAIAAAIARHMRLDIGEDDIAEIVRELAAADPSGPAEEPGPWWDSLDPAEQQLASGALDAYRDFAAGAELGSVTWESPLFFLGDQPAARATQGVDITGRTRCLLRGPEIMLPAGDWSLTAAFDFSPEAAEHSFLLELAAGASLSRTVIQPTRAGLLEANLPLALADLPDQPIDLRLYNERPAFGGHVTLVKVTVTPHPRAADEPL